MNYQLYYFLIIVYIFFGVFTLTYSIISYIKFNNVMDYYNVRNNTEKL
jgi:hypothetical protein